MNGSLFYLSDAKHQSIILLTSCIPKTECMKILKPILFLLFLCNCSSSIFGQKKIALIVAIGNYPTNQRAWKNLSSNRDLFYIREALIKNGFEASNIKALIDSNATKAGMVKALDALIAKAANGDIVYFHFSGHGQQIQDSETDGILDEADGYDEALIPYDAKGVWDQVDYHGENHFRDDLLGEKLLAVRKKIGSTGSVVAVIDACHSGTATRSAGIVRGSEIPCQAYGYKPNIVIDLNKNPEAGLLDNMGSNMGNLVVFSGSSPNQVNRETKDDAGKSVGSLSFAFAKAITNLPPNCNYQSLFEKVKATIQADEPIQIPMFEGNGALKVFGNQYIPLREIIAVEMGDKNSENGTNDTSFFISRGLYHNVHEGSTVSVFKLGDSTIFCKAIIKQANNFQSICIAEKRLPKKNNYEVKIDGANFGRISASYVIQNIAGSLIIEKQLSHFLQPQAFLSISNNPDYTININQQGNKYAIQLIEKNDSIRYAATLFKEDTLSSVDLENILDNMKKGMRVRYLRKMQDGGSIANMVRVAIVPNKPKQPENELILYPNDDFSLILTSNYDGELYYTILDLLPDNNVKVLVPDSSKNAADYSIRKGQTIKIPMGADSTSLTGKEFLKVIFTPKPIDLRPSFEKYRTRSSNAKPLERLMDDLFPKNKNLATRAGVVQLEEIGIVTAGFTLKKR